MSFERYANVAFKIIMSGFESKEYPFEGLQSILVKQLNDVNLIVAMSDT